MRLIEERASALEAVGRRLELLPGSLVALAVAENSWFSRADILHAIHAIRTQLLDGAALRRWMMGYSADIAAFGGRHYSRTGATCHSEVVHQRGRGICERIEPGPPTALVIMAGNIPMVGFFDMLCVAAAGWRCLYKPSSKDTILIDFAAAALRAEGFAVERWDEIAPPADASAPRMCAAGIAAVRGGDVLCHLPMANGSVPDSVIPSEAEGSLTESDGQSTIAALIATGSDNARRYFETAFAGTNMLLRGTRGSVAVLSGEETCEQIAALSRDIFSYSGLGCRSVSHLLLPEGYEIEALAAALSESGAPSAGWLANFRQRRAVLDMQWRATRESAGTPPEPAAEAPTALTTPDFTEGEFFVLRRSEEFSEHLSEITYSFTPPGQWLAAHARQVQCVVGSPTQSVPQTIISFGAAQSPSLWDYADGVDTMKFLLAL